MRNDVLFDTLPPSLELGREAARNGRFDSARRAFEAAADRGEREGFFELGLLYWYGHGVPRSLEKATALIRLAAERGLPDAQHQLGLILWPTDKTEAETWTLRAGEAGHAPALTRLAEIFGDRDPKAARALLQRAAAKGHPPAMIGFGLVLAGGLGGPADPVEGLAWLYAAVALTGDKQVERDIHALARALNARQISAAHKCGRDIARKFKT